MIVCLPVLATVAACGGPSADPGKPTVFVDVTIVPLTPGEPPQSGRTVVVENGRITAMGRSDTVRYPLDANLIYGRGRFLMPAMADMHAVSVSAADGPLYIANGVTVVRVVSGDAETLTLAGGFASGETLGPRMIVGAPRIAGAIGLDAPAAPSSAPVSTVADPAAAAAVVRAHAAAGFAAVSLHEGLDGPMYRRAAAEAEHFGLAIWSAVADPFFVETVIWLGVASIEGLDGYGAALARGARREATRPDEDAATAQLAFDPGPALITAEDWTLADLARAPALAALTARYGVWNCPTLTLLRDASRYAADPDVFFRGPGARFVDARQRSAWRLQAEPAVARAELDNDGHAQRLAMVAALHEAGAPLLLGSGAGEPYVLAGMSLHDEIKYFRDAGLPPRDVLRIATAGAAQFLGEEGEWGVVAPGARADLVLLDRDPLADLSVLRRPMGVMVGGRWFDRGALDAQLRARAARRAAAGLRSQP